MTETPSFLERRRDAAAAEYFKQLADERRVAAIVLGENPPPGQVVGTIVKLGDDYLVEVPARAGQEEKTTWTTVVGGKRDIYHFGSQDDALLYLIARRNGMEGTDAAYYAGRVLGLSTRD